MPKRIVKKKIKTIKKVSRKKDDDSKLLAFVATFFSIVGFIIVFLIKRDDKYVMFYAKQSLVLFIGAIIIAVIDGLFLFIPIIGWFISAVLELIVVVFWVLSWVYALSGEKKELPYIGKYGKHIKI